MQVRVNGKIINLDGDITVLDFLNNKNKDIKSVAVELNKKILPKNLYGDTKLKDGDILEIVHFVGGG